MHGRRRERGVLAAGCKLTDSERRDVDWEQTRGVREKTRRRGEGRIVGKAKAGEVGERRPGGIW